MTRERIARALLLAYPDTLRGSHGPEMIATLLDCSDGSSRAFIGELFGLLRGGLRARSRVTATVDLRRLIADGFCLGGALWIVATLNAPPYFMPTSWRFWLLPVALALALAGYDRASSLFWLAWIVLDNLTALAGVDAYAASPPDARSIVAQDLGPIIFLVAMVLAPRRRPRDLRRLLWLVPVAAVAYAGSLGAGPFMIATIAVSLAGLASLSTDPRLAIAAALWWTSLAVGDFGTGWGISPATVALALPGPIVVALACARVRQLKQREAA